MSQCKFSILFNKKLLVKYKIMKVPHGLDLTPCDFFWFSKLKIQFQDKIWELWKKYESTALYHFKSFRNASTNGKLIGISVLNTKVTILKKINILLIVYFCFSKYSFNLYTFWSHLPAYIYIVILSLNWKVSF